MSKVVLFKGAARFDAANRYVDELAEGLRACGREVVTLHDGEPGFSERLRRELDFRCEFAAGFDGAGSLVEGPDPFIGGRIPRIHLSLEHPAYHWSQFHLADHHWCTADRSVLPFAERAFGGRRPLHFLPMGATPPEGEPAWGERHGIVFAGGYEDPDAIMARWRRHFTSDLAELLQLMAAHAVAHPEKPLLAALEEVFAANDFPGGEELLRRYVPSAYVEVDRAVRNYRRLMVLRALDDAGMAVDLFGPGCAPPVSTTTATTVRSPTTTCWPTTARRRWCSISPPTWSRGPMSGCSPPWPTAPAPWPRPTPGPTRTWPTSGSCSPIAGMSWSGCRRSWPG